MTEPSALFVPDGELFQPTELTSGPWRPDHQHGGPPSALLGFLIERLVEPDEVIARVSIELVRGVPLTPLRTVARRASNSRRVHHVEAELHDEHQLVARARALVLNAGELPTPGWAPPTPAVVLPGPEATINLPAWTSGDGRRYHSHAIENRFVTGEFEHPGPAHTWMRLKVPVVDGHAATGLQRTLAAADFGSGISAVYGRDAGFGMINADLIVAFHRDPVGEWISVDGITHLNPRGTGQGIAHLGDELGPTAISTQSLLGTSY